MDPLHARRIARVLAAHGLDGDSATDADIDAAAAHDRLPRPETRDDRYAVRDALADLPTAP
ncbi:hypothetical protein [Streptomyces sp. WMMC897]|uniref:hypothetical protein n=1 Tax=Streptomyces sp. WMMC897 TaxID=3014782 RepID=UPI0022B6B745|nr:hypothetical protein [Streptomyces sp. WMMC897]MCZ7413122.1 hypothetical protein [Streptomyces sp. WMMC897]MCZ7415494.1 hypothetical protein [Streptomyces sp. WMMC897]